MNLKQLCSCFASGEEPNQQGNGRDRWLSRPMFIIAAIAAAVGLGNVWRFPYLAYKFGGGAFFIPYLLALFIVGIPILILEFALGQVFQSGDIAAFGSISKRLRGVGFASVFSAFIIVCYYNAIISYTLNYFVGSFQSPLPWTAADGSLDNANSYLFDSVLKYSGEVSTGNIAGNVLLGVFFTWVVIFLSTYKGVHLVSKIVVVTMFVPFALLFILFIRGITLPGAGAGIAIYIGQWDLSQLSDGRMWAESVTQIFFSIGICFGIMTAYSSYNSRDQSCVADALTVGLSNSAISIFAGFVVFSILGFLSDTTGIPVTEIADKGSGISLAFLTYPTALALLPWAPNLFCALFFLCLFFLGIDSAFSLNEAVTTAFGDSSKYNSVSRTVVVGGFCTLGLVISVVYTLDIGLTILDVVDYYINNVTMLVVGFFETASIGWMYRCEDQMAVIGAAAVFVHGGTWLLASVIGVIVATTTEAWIGLVVALCILVIGISVSVFLANRDVDTGAPSMGHGAMWWLFMSNSELARVDLNAIVAKGDRWSIPTVWGILMKYALPQIMIVMLGINCNGLVESDGYGGYTIGYQILGMVASLVGVVFIVIGIVAPDAFLPMCPPANNTFLISDTQGDTDYAMKTKAESEMVSTSPLEEKADMVSNAVAV